MKKLILILFIFFNVFPLYSGIQGYIRNSKNDNQKIINTDRSARNSLNTVKKQKTVKKNIRNYENIVNKIDVKARTSSIVRKSNITDKNKIVKPVVRNKVRTAKVSGSLSRSAITPIAKSSVFGVGYNGCRDAYFTCMDQFCAKKDEKYRRCVCSNKLKEIQEKEFALFQTGEHLQDFHNLNLDVISKTKNEVKAMISSTVGEKAMEKARDNSESASKLEDITSVLNSTKKSSLSNKDALSFIENLSGDFGDDGLGISMKSDIMNLSGDKLYNAVHMQCLDFVKNKCTNQATINMVTSAYGMNIENDCSNVLSNLDKKIIEAERQVKKTEQEVNDERTKLYKSQNATAINDCIAKVRQDITDDNVCGKDYVHCLDFTGRYLDYKTGEPIYTPNFAEFTNYLDLEGDFIKNPNNSLVVSSMNAKKEYAKKGLSTCRDISKDVWNEFLKQSIKEIYQQNNQRIDKVKADCIDVINNCLDKQTGNLKDFASVKDASIFAINVETAEKLCKSKLDTCQNIYKISNKETIAKKDIFEKGSILEKETEQSCKEKNTNQNQKEKYVWENDKCIKLVGKEIEITKTDIDNYSTKIGDQKIIKECRKLLEDFVDKICAVPISDKEHVSPYGCRTFSPGNSYSLDESESLIKTKESDEDDYYKCYNLNCIIANTFKTNKEKEDGINKYCNNTKDFGDGCIYKSGIRKKAEINLEPPLNWGTNSFRYIKYGNAFCKVKLKDAEGEGENRKQYMCLDERGIITNFSKNTTEKYCPYKIALRPKLHPSYSYYIPGMSSSNGQSNGQCNEGSDDYYCLGKDHQEKNINNYNILDYGIINKTGIPFDGFFGSIYQKIAIRAAEVCIRPGIDLSKDKIPSSVKEDIVFVASKTVNSIQKMLKTECETKKWDKDDKKTLWLDFSYTKFIGSINDLDSKTGYQIVEDFYNKTGTNFRWLGCVKEKEKNANNNANNGG